ncbi:MAG: signal peptidase I [Bdellovibrionales bacterium RBG_16_40_8]|nr:MAG: signal peptidase I [Bdellovibrionales bacterium RBG_16_40_8]
MNIFTKLFWTEGVGSFLIAIGIALTIRWAFMEAYVIPSSSMLPTLLIHDHIFVNKFVYGLRIPFTEKWMVNFSDPKRGDVIVFKFPENMDMFYIKRVVGVGGDKVYYENGNLYINDELVKNEVPLHHKSDFAWLRDSDFQRDGQGALSFFDHYEEKIGDQSFSILLRKGKKGSYFGPITVPTGHYFVMGDNRDNSNDSRFWRTTNFVPRDNLVGRAMFVWLSCEDTLPVVKFLCNPLEIRWKRFFHTVHE